MKELNWDYDKNTAHWAKKCPLSIESDHPKKQYDGRDYRLWEDTWKKHISNPNFPEYCHYPHSPGSLLASPSNIIKCFVDGNALEALALTVAWGRMTRAKGNIYTMSNQAIDEILHKCIQLTKEKNSIEDSWNLLVRKLDWGHVAASKFLHFLVRSLGCEANPPVPIDKKVFLGEVWPAFKKRVRRYGDYGNPQMPGNWWDNSTSWNCYNRYMTAILCWANQKGWTTTQLENTIFEEYYPRK